MARQESWRLLERRRRESVVEEVPEVAVRDPTDDWARDEWLYEGLLALDSRSRELIIALYLSPGPSS